MAGFYLVLSILGIALGALMVKEGAGGGGLGAAATLFLGLFFVAKEVLDIIQSGGK